ncbi:MAG: SDR family NAD(P)-dependent oxidoreductase, partial [Acidiferrobacterales bacterium]
MRLKDKVAIITGSSRGIGKAIALRFSAEGAKVVINYHKMKDLADAVVGQIRSEGAEAVAVQADVAQRAHTDRLRDETLSAFGQIDILVSNAGIIIDRPYIESTIEDWDAIINTNLRGFFNVTQSVLPHMIERK